MTKSFYFLLLILAGLLFFVPETMKPGNLGSKIIILAAGDSLTAANYPAHLENLLKKEGGRNVRVINLGRKGNTSREYLKFLTGSSGWKTPFPDWILLQLGTNDVRIDGDHTPTDIFEKNMKAIIRLFQTEAGRRNKIVKIALATIPPVCVSRSFDESSVKRVGREINPKIKEISGRFGWPVVDNYGLFVKNPRELPGIHPSKEGYALLAENWFQFLKDRLNREE